MRKCRSQATRGARRPAVGLGLRRAAAAVPAMFGSVLLVAVAAGGLGRWGGPILPM